MKGIINLIAVLAVVFLIPTVVTARGAGDQGYGAMVGNPTALSAKYWFNQYWGIDGAVGIARSEFDIHATALYHVYGWAQRAGGIGNMFRGLTSRGELPFYFGAGPRLLFEDDEEWGIRTPIGLSFLPHQSRWEWFIEFAPVIRLTQDFGFNGDYSVGVRYYFEPIRPRTQE